MLFKQAFIHTVLLRAHELSVLLPFLVFEHLDSHHPAGQRNTFMIDCLGGEQSKRLIPLKLSLVFHCIVFVLRHLLSVAPVILEQ